MYALEECGAEARGTDGDAELLLDLHQEDVELGVVVEGLEPM